MGMSGLAFASGFLVVRNFLPAGHSCAEPLPLLEGTRQGREDSMLHCLQGSKVPAFLRQ